MKSRNHRQPRNDNALTNVQEPEDQESASTIGHILASSKSEPANTVEAEVEENDTSSTSTSRKRTGRNDLRMPLRTESSSSVLMELEDSDLDAKPRLNPTSKREKEASTSTSKFFDQSNPNGTQVEKQSEKKRGKKRQRVNSDGEAKLTVDKPTMTSKKSTTKQETPSMQVKLEEATSVIRDTKNAPKQKKSKPSPVTSADKALPSVPPPAFGKTTIDVVTAPATGNDSIATASSNSSSSQTARQLAERARTMKEREELTQIRKDNEALGKKLEEAKSERDEMQKKVEGTRKEVGFKDEVSLVGSSRSCERVGG